MRVFKLTPKSPAELISRDAVLEALLARERVNRAILEHGAFSDPASLADAAYKASRVTATKALRAAAVTVAPRRRARFGGLPATTNGLRSDPAPEIRTEAEVLADAVAAGQALGLLGSDLDCHVYLSRWSEIIAHSPCRSGLVFKPFFGVRCESLCEDFWPPT